MRTAWNKGLIEYKKCKVCESQIRKWLTYCSKECMRKGKNPTDNLGKWAVKGATPWNKGLIGVQEGYWKGKKRPEISVLRSDKKRPEISGKNHWAWGKKRPEVSGENNWKWKGGVTTPDKRQRAKFRSTMQRLVFERDNYTCQMCGANGNLQVDHIQSWAEYVDQRFNIDNCRTLCAVCHYEITFGRPMPKEVKTWGQNFKLLAKEVF